MKAYIYLLLLIFISACQQEGRIKDPDAKPNVVIIVTDDQGWGDLSYNGNTNISTPNIDRISQEGAILNHFYVSPVCSPTRAELLTGRYHLRSGVHGTSQGSERMSLDETTIAEIFQQAGYKTGAFGKWHNGMQYPYHPNARGFNEYYGFCSGHWGNYFDPMLERNGQIVDGKGFIIDDLTDKAMDFIEANQSEPFFVYIPYNTPHSPMQVPDRWWDEFENKDLELKNRDPEREEPDFTRAALALCKNIDWNVGRVSQKLEELGLAENTILIYFSDNGPNSWRWNGGMKGRKGSTDEGGVRSPCVVQWPARIKAAQKIDEITAAIDWLPTLTDMAGIQIPANLNLDGESIKPLLVDEEANWPDRLIFSHWNDRVSVRSQRYRLDHEGQLFDLTEDPGQQMNLASEFPDVLEKLSQNANLWYEEVRADFIPMGEQPFVVAHPDFKFTQLPARDAVGYGNIQRSNRWPNSSYFTNWTSITDSISWQVEVLAEGEHEVEVYYTCPAEDVGANFELTFNGQSVSGKISEAHDPPLLYPEYDRVARMESYEKPFKPLKIGKIQLPKGKGWLTLKATEIPGSQVMEFRLMMLTRIGS